MENQQPQSTVPTIWETNPKLKTLLLVLIFVFLISGIGLTAFSVWSNNYRQKVYEETKAGLPVHKEPNLQLADELVDTSGWKIFNSKEFGFSLKTPKTWASEPTEYMNGEKAIEYVSSNEKKNPYVSVTVGRYKEDYQYKYLADSEFVLPNSMIARQRIEYTQYGKNKFESFRIVIIYKNGYYYGFDIQYHYDYETVNSDSFVSKSKIDKDIVNTILSTFEIN